MSVLALAPRRTEEPHYTMVAVDGADDDGGTLYVLYDEHGRQITGSAWPQPLEAIAELAGFLVQTSSYVPSDRSDCEVPGRRRLMTIDTELMRRTQQGPIPPVDDDYPDNDLSDEPALAQEFSKAVKPCKIDGCERPVHDRAGIYGGLCLEHKEQRREQKRKAGRCGGKVAAHKRAAHQVSESTEPGRLVKLARRIELVVEQVAAMEAGLQELVDEFNREVHTRSTA